MLRLLLILVALVAGCARAATTVQIAIDMRAEIAARRFDPQRDRVGVRGSALPLAWDRSAIAHDGNSDGRFEIELRFDEVPFGGQPAAYKFKIERADDPAAGWEAGRNHPLLLHAAQQRLERAFDAEPLVLPLVRTGRIERIAALPSRHVNAREVQVWLPPGYEREPQRRYPVLYLHDGQNVFDAASAGAEWQVDETAQRLMTTGAVEPAIVVAVASTAARVVDYTPSAAAFGGGAPSGGGAARYARYLVDELKPFIDARYQTLTGVSNTAVGGSSLGGLVTMWLLLHHADTFGAGLVVSPSVWWGDEIILRELASIPATRHRPRVWLDIGLREGDEVVAGVRRLRDALRAQGWSLSYAEQADAGHDEAAWASRVEGMLRFLYTPR